MYVRSCVSTLYTHTHTQTHTHTHTYIYTDTRHTNYFKMIKLIGMPHKHTYTPTNTEICWHSSICL